MSARGTPAKGGGGRIALAAVLLVAALLSLFDARRDSATADEPSHVAAGAVLVASRSWTLTPEHPPLAKAAYGLAARAAGGTDPVRVDFRDFVRSTRGWLLAPRPGLPVGTLLVAARTAAIGFFLALLWAAYLAAGGGLPGALAAALLLGHRALYAHGHLATTDVPVTLFSLAGVAALLAFRSRPTLARGAGAALLVAAALASKSSGLLLLAFAPLFLLAAALTTREQARRRPLLSGAAGIPAGAVVLLALFLRLASGGESPSALATVCRLYRMDGSDTALLLRIDRVDRGLARYAFGVLFNLRQAAGGRSTWYLGERTERPGPSYHVVALAAKSPLTWLLAVGAALLLALRPGGSPRARLLLGAAAFFLLASLPGPRIGVRHVFPVVALATAGAGAALGEGLSRTKGSARAAAILVALSPLALGRSLGSDGAVTRFLPDPPLADSNLDWGQDLLRLGDLLSARGIPPSELSVVYFGGDLPGARLPGVVDHLEAEAPLRRYVAVSRQYLLVGADAATLSGGAPRVAAALAAVRSPGVVPLGRAGDSIDLFALPGPGR